ncbi:MAG: hypothetical protein HRF42_12220 [Candidatus Brocadia sp.]
MTTNLITVLSIFIKSLKTEIKRLDDKVENLDKRLSSKIYSLDNKIDAAIQIRERLAFLGDKLVKWNFDNEVKLICGDGRRQGMSGKTTDHGGFSLKRLNHILMKIGIRQVPDGRYQW